MKGGAARDQLVSCNGNYLYWSLLLKQRRTADRWRAGPRSLYARRTCSASAEQQRRRQRQRRRATTAAAPEIRRPGAADVLRNDSGPGSSTGAGAEPHNLQPERIQDPEKTPESPDPYANARARIYRYTDNATRVKQERPARQFYSIHKTTITEQRTEQAAGDLDRARQANTKRHREARIGSTSAGIISKALELQRKSIRPKRRGQPPRRRTTADSRRPAQTGRSRRPCARH